MNLIATNLNRHELAKLPICIDTLCKRKKDGHHIHDYTQIWYVLSGNIINMVSDTQYIQTPGTCIIVPPYVSHYLDTSQSEDTPICVSFSFTDSFFTDRGYSFFSFSRSNCLFENSTLSQFSKLNGAAKDIADMTIHKMLSEFDKHEKFDPDYICELLAEFLRMLDRNAPEKKNIPVKLEHARAVSNVLTYISEHCSEKLNIDKLCDIALMSRRSFTRNFKLITGRSVMEFVSKLRLQRAAWQLLTTEKTLSEIAEDVGIYDKSHLSRMFTADSGMTPSTFRKLNSKRIRFEDNELKLKWKWIERVNK